jgi:predicted  nucleic acid-binding Zn-ribbon protein
MMVNEKQRAIAVCTMCGRRYAAEQRSDGNIRLLGRAACDCGSTTFRLISSDFEIVDEFDEQER